MKSVFKKINYIILIIIMLLVNLIIPSDMEVQAKTLRDLKGELSSKESEYQTSQNKKKLTQNEIATKKSNIVAIKVEINDMQIEMQSLNKEIEELGLEIIDKELEIKQIMNYYQLSNGESAYLEYIFNAADFTDFIYRMAIAEELSNYNDKLVDEYNRIIKENEEKKKELASKTVSLNKKQNELQSELESLNNQLDKVLEQSVSIEEEIKALKESINIYENVYKCNLDDSLDTCIGNQLPPGTAFYRPVTSGMISSNYGYRTYYLNGSWVTDFHEGIDFAGTGHGANVYSAANGKVSAIFNRTKAGYMGSCGGNMLFIDHYINGKKYTTGYFHLATIRVRLNQTVTYNDIIGTVGGNPSIETWDRCSTGTHLHFQISTGYYETYYKFSSRSFNPRNTLNVPGEGGWFSSRTIKY